MSVLSLRLVYCRSQGTDWAWSTAEPPTVAFALINGSQFWCHTRSTTSNWPNSYFRSVTGSHGIRGRNYCYR